MIPNKNDPLAALFIDDAKVVDRHHLTILAAPFLSIDKSSREFVVLPSFSNINGNTSKIEILLVAAKARALYFDGPDGLLPGELIAIDIMPTGSIKSSLKKLFDAHKIKRDKEGRYFIPAYRIPELVKQFTDSNPQK